MGPSMAVRGGTTHPECSKPTWGKGVGSRPTSGTDSGDGQARGAQAREGKGAHRGAGLRAVLYLPSYSPDLNPIEEAFAKVKHILREIAARAKGTLIEALGRALEAVSTEDVRGLFVQCRYRPP